MTTFTVFENYEGKLKAVPKGASMGGALFSAIWAVSVGLYVPAIAWLAGYLIVNAYDSWAGPVVDTGDGFPIYHTFFYGIVMCVVFAAFGNQWLEKELLRKGYIRRGTINTKSKGQACALYKQWKDSVKKND